MLSQGAVLLGQHFVRRGKTQVEFAKEIGISQGSLSGYLTGSIVPSLRQAKRLSEMSKGKIKVESWLTPASATAAERHDKALREHSARLFKKSFRASKAA